MPAATYNFQIEQGSEHSITFIYQDANGNPIDLSAKCVVLRWLDSNGALATFSSATTASLENASGYSLTGNNLGEIVFEIAAAKTQEYTFATATYDLDIVETVGTLIRNTRILTGTIGLITRNFSLVTNCAQINSDPGVPLPDDGAVITSTPSASTSITSTPATPTPSPVDGSNDLCLPEDCLNIDVFSRVYTGSGITINDYQNNSGYITVSNTGTIENVELAVNGLRHTSPQDLTFILIPPSGSGILLSANSKIANYSSGFSFMFSNRASSGNYLYNTTNGGLINILNKTNLYDFGGTNLTYSFNHLINSTTTGVWTFYTNDNDPGVSGSIDSWKLILTYTSTDSGSEE